MRWAGAPGPGGVGLAAVDVASAMGANVIAISRTQAKLDKAMELGAVAYLKAGEGVPEQIQEMTGGGEGFGTYSSNLMLAASLMGINFRIASPQFYAIDEETLSLARNNTTDGVLCTDQSQLAVEGADIVYTDVWASMGQESEQVKRKQVFEAFQVNQALLKHAAEDVIVMHCLPAHRGEEISENVLEGLNSVVWDQAENKLHMHKAILEVLMKED